MPHRGSILIDPTTTEGESWHLDCTGLRAKRKGYRFVPVSQAGEGTAHRRQLVKRASSRHLEPQRRKRALIAHWLTSP